MSEPRNCPFVLTFLFSLPLLPSLVSPAVGIERDAVSIFTKYVSPDASRPIPITEQIRNDIVGKKAILNMGTSIGSNIKHSSRYAKCHHVVLKSLNTLNYLIISSVNANYIATSL